MNDESFSHPDKDRAAVPVPFKHSLDAFFAAWSIMACAGCVAWHSETGIVLPPGDVERGREHRELFAKRFGKRGVNWCVLEAQASNAAVNQRLRAREAKPDEVSDARLEDFAMLTRLYEPPAELAAGHCVKVRTYASLDQTLTRALQGLARLQQDSLVNRRKRKQQAPPKKGNQ